MIALVLGSASCVYDDASRALGLLKPGLVIAVNDMIANWEGEIDHAATLHVEKLPVWMRARMERQAHRPVTWSHTGCKQLGRLGLEADRLLSDLKGSSGLFGATVALHLGYRAVLCGVPMQPVDHVAGLSREGWNGKPWPEQQVENYRAAWALNLSRIADRVRSMSGWTAELLGEPDARWLASSGH